MIDLKKTLNIATKSLREAGVDFALIGGFALSAHGIHRATQDIDFIADGSKKELIKSTLLNNGFNIVYETEEILQLKGPGYIDILFANRPLSIEMLEKSKTNELFDVPVISAEGLIGLKIQAYTNDESRRYQDLADIQNLLKISGLNLVKIKEYADLFNAYKDIESFIKQ